MTDLTSHLRVGLQGRSEMVVSPEHLASRWKSGGVDVLSTPQLVGLMELAALSAVDHLLPPEWLTVGTHVDIEHLAATSPGQPVTAEATLTAVAGRRLSFEVSAWDAAGVIGRGTHRRYIVQRERFLASAASRARDATDPSA